MQKKKIIAVVAAVSVLAVAATATAMAGSFQKPTVTCPNCGTEVECQMPDRGEKPMSLDELKASLAEKVAAGEITQEEADAQIAKCEERQASMEERKADMKAKLDEKVQNGEMTQEEADKILEGGGRMGAGKMDGQGNPNGSGKGRGGRMNQSNSTTETE